MSHCYFDNKTVILLGDTGSGKSSFGNLIARLLAGHKCDVFKVGHGMGSVTSQPQDFTVDGVTIVDSPGLLDSSGRDEKHIEKVVQAAVEKERVNGFLIVMNCSTTRISGPFKKAIQVLIDSFGPEFLNQTALLLTRAGTYTGLKKFTEDFLHEMKVGVEPTEFTKGTNGIEFGSNFRSWQIENCDESTDKVGASTIREILAWVKTQPVILTHDCKPGQFQETKCIRDLTIAKEKAEIAHGNAINPEATVQVTTAVPILTRRDQSNRHGRREIGGVFGGRKYRDVWDVVTYRNVVTTTYYKNNGELHSVLEHNAGEYEREENRKTVRA